MNRRISSVCAPPTYLSGCGKLSPEQERRPIPEPFLSLDTHKRAEILHTAAANSIHSAVILEKDIWVRWILQVLFAMPDHHPMAFKGGTSLSKVYGTIDRFSEDVDITLDYRGFGDDCDPFANDVSRNAIKRLTERLRNSVACYVHDIVAPTLDAAVRSLASDGRHHIHIGDDGETVRFAYPSSINVSNSYVAREVLLESGDRNVIDPNECHMIFPDTFNLTEGIDFPSAHVTVLSPVRTFWEKATLIHVACHRRQLANRPDRLSRHWFELACLAVHPVGRAALAQRNILADVVRHKEVFFHAGNANYDHCLNGHLRLVPDDDQLPALHSDYDAMRHGNIIADGAPEFETLIEQIRYLEMEVNLVSSSGVSPKDSCSADLLSAP